ncbi:MAG: alpha/beta hydrolase [Bacilli bacterium]|nr:alpha/beta hydrolase [Bacilli bacterium]
MYYEFLDYELFYEKCGCGKKNILILPGWGETRVTFFRIINYFKENYTVYILDYPGFGNSPFPNKDMTIYDYAILIKNFLIDLKIDNPIIIAHSFGGRIATILSTILDIKVEKMLFMDIAGIKPKKKFRQWIREKIYKLKKKFISYFCKNSKERRLNRLRKKYGSTDYNTLPQNMLTTFRNVVNEDLKCYFKDIKSEVLLIWGARDIDTPLKDAYYINKQIKNSHLIVFKDGDHFTYLQYNDAILLIIEEFIKN